MGALMSRKMPDEVFEEIIDAVPDEPVEELIDGLTPEERAEIEADAQVLVEKETKERAKKDFKAKALAEARRKANWDLTGGMITVHINLPGHAECITVNGVKYYHDGVYTVPKDLGTFLMEKQFRCWKHENQIGGTSKEVVRARNLKIGINDVDIPTASILHG
jgi:hypothetical protein